MSQAAIVFHQVSKIFARNGSEVQALQDINLHINQGDIFGVIGTSGAGKSTLLRLINHLETPTTGTVEVQGEALPGISKKRLIEVKKQIGMIFQHFNLLNARTVFHNVAIPLILQGRSKDFIATRVAELLAFVNLSDKANSYPDELSGGQKQRVGIARALATNPAILLCDEATSALDPQTTVQILLLLQEINQRYGITIVLITHEMSVVQKICNRMAVMAHGRIVEQGDVLRLFAEPQQAVSASFVQSVIHDRLPQQTLELLSEHPAADALRLEFVGSTAQQPVINQLIRNYEVEVNILFASMTEVQRTILGFMIVQIKGEPAQREAAIQFLIASGVKISDV
ncbi:methionine ABC transporter ATP-binding protein [Pantoea agglomerans]|uniref:methionine ABC transporter ATP-binding protein n=1 Tax=Pantoea vagans TaxID=470934 RepID=UPI000BF08A4C|nr:MULTISPECIES: ATP-binding cassette domain-containing protein [Pantoea]MDE8557677.1 ATP-binding cassette domain-containing protein [Pantoea vagans]MDE8577245.1 ATP-binding cassette domain-containing protein [Pantoea vagans]PEI06158.1 methionine ABC transporter ATP-binding protein [Pantoea agglomerans]